MEKLNQKTRAIYIIPGIVLIITVLMSQAVFAAKYADPSVEVYAPGTLSDSHTVVEYRDGVIENYPEGQKLTLLMLNGSFMSGAEILIENNRSLVPIRVVSEKLNSRVDWNMDEKTVTITTLDGRYATLRIGVPEAETDSGTIALDVAPTINNSKTYVPLRLVAQVLNCDVDYRADLFGRGVSAIIIEERYGYDPLYTENEALTTVKRLSGETYDGIKLNFGGALPEGLDYDSQAIALIDSMGRYYVFSLAGFEEFPLLFDMYGGDVYSLKIGLPFLYIGDGFANIGWMFQQ